MRVRTILPIAAFTALAAFACRDEASRAGGPWGPSSRGGTASQNEAPAAKAPTAEQQQQNAAPAGAELAHHPERAMPYERGQGPHAGVQMAPDRAPAPGKPTGMGGGPSVTGRAGNQFERATGAPDNR